MRSVWKRFARHQCNLAARESGLECTCMNNEWLFTVLVSGGHRCHWVSMCTVLPMHSKWLSEQSNKSASNFALSLNIPPKKLFRWLRRLQLWATGDWQLHHSNVPAHASCLLQLFGKITHVTQPHYSPDLAPGDVWLFPKLKSPLKGKSFQSINETQENMTGQLMETGRTVWGPKVPTLKGTEASLSFVSIFHITWLETFSTDLIHMLSVGTVCLVFLLVVIQGGFTEASVNK